MKGKNLLPNLHFWGSMLIIGGGSCNRRILECTVLHCFGMLCTDVKYKKQSGSLLVIHGVNSYKLPFKWVYNFFHPLINGVIILLIPTLYYIIYIFIYKCFFFNIYPYGSNHLLRMVMEPKDYAAVIEHPLLII